MTAQGRAPYPRAHCACPVSCAGPMRLPPWSTSPLRILLNSKSNCIVYLGSTSHRRSSNSTDLSPHSSPTLSKDESTRQEKMCVPLYMSLSGAKFADILLWSSSNMFTGRSSANPHAHLPMVSKLTPFTSRTIGHRCTFSRWLFVISSTFLCPLLPILVLFLILPAGTTVSEFLCLDASPLGALVLYICTVIILMGTGMYAMYYLYRELFAYSSDTLDIQ